MHHMTKSQATTPIPVQLSGPEFIAFIFPHLSMPMRGPKCKLGYHCVFNLILWVLYTGMQWKCMPVPRASDGTALIHYTTIYKVFAKWADDGSLGQGVNVGRLLWRQFWQPWRQRRSFDMAAADREPVKSRQHPELERPGGTREARSTNE